MNRPLVMGILNVTPDSFSDGGHFADVNTALSRAEQMIGEGVDIIDIGGESTRPNSSRVDVGTELSRTVPVIEAIVSRFDIAVSIDTSKYRVARHAVDAGAEIINDISGLRWEPAIADIAAANGTALVLMHSPGEFETMHSLPPVDDIVSNVITGLNHSIATAREHGVDDTRIALDIGLGFGKTYEQNFELLAKLDNIADDLMPFPLLAGASRKSFIGKASNAAEPKDRLGGSIAAAVIAVMHGAKIVRVHDVRETVSALKVLTEIENGS